MGRKRGEKKKFDDGFHPTPLQLATFSVPVADIKVENLKRKKK